MTVNVIKRLYDLLLKKENNHEIRTELHRYCDNCDFDNILNCYSDYANITMMINYIKKEYDLMLQEEKEIFKITEKKLKRRIEKIKLVDELYKKYSNPFIIFDKVLKLYKNPKSMYKEYTFLTSYIGQNPGLNEIEDLLERFGIYYNDFKNCFNNDVHKTVINAYQDNNDYNQYLYAEFIIKEYIVNEDSYLLDSFLERYSIDIDTFNYFLKIIKFRNKSLFEKYLLKKQENDYKAKDYYKHMYDDLAYAIKNEEFVYGNKFDVLEFIKYLPFKENDDFMQKTDDFLSHNNPLIKDIILSYMDENGIINNDDLKPIKIDSLHQVNIILKGEAMSTDNISNILNYLLSREIPICKISLRKASEMYLNNKIDISNENDLRLVKRYTPIIIPKSN